MKKLLLILLIFTGISCIGYCNSNENINIYNLKENNTYILNIDYNAEKIEISDGSLIEITPVTTITDGKEHQLIIETTSSGICDVLIKSENQSYKYRFITGKNFQDNKDELIELDLPPLASL